MSEHITYLFGAGASCNALPVGDAMSDSIKDLIGYLDKDNLDLSEYQFEYPHKENISLHPEKYRHQLIEDLKWLSEAAATHASIDTYAKKLFITAEKRTLKKLKASLSAFFAIRQILFGIDRRYDHYFANIINESCNDLPLNIKILNWNYDSQFEKAFYEFSKEEYFSGNNSRLNIKTKTHGAFASPDKFGIYKINGTAGLRDKSNEQYYFHMKPSDKLYPKNFIEILANYYYLNSPILGIESSLSFAWENENGENSLVNVAINDIAKTSILVIIGYSFPFFNRQIDRRIINSMKYLRKVYIQSLEVNNIIERFEATRNNSNELEIVPQNNVRWFHIPNEL